MTPDEVREVAKQAADETVNNLFLHFGIDLEHPDTSAQLRKDYAHLRSWRESTETIKKVGLRTAVAVVVTGMLGGLWLIFRPD